MEKKSYEAKVNIKREKKTQIDHGHIRLGTQFIKAIPFPLKSVSI
jgi:hypothetical protein